MVRPPVLLLHGQSDDVVPALASFSLKNALEQGNQLCDYHSFQGGHTIPAEAQVSMKKALRQWLAMAAQQA